MLPARCARLPCMNMLVSTVKASPLGSAKRRLGTKPKPPTMAPSPYCRTKLSSIM